jgi:CheY-like chemotaxis protein
MVNAHGGTIKAESSGKNRGATFIVTLATVAAPALIPAIPKARGPKEAAAKAAQVKGTGPRVLVVDDHVDTCTGMKMMLERRGYRVTVAHTADQAVAKAGQEEFDLVISDIGLPDRSGYELMKELGTTRGLRGIALSGFGMENDVSRARAAGFSEHLTKPINFDRLDELIQMLLGEARSSGPIVIKLETGARRSLLSRFALGGFLQFAGKLLHALAHDFAGLELYGRPGWDHKTAARLIGVAAHARLGQARLKHAKVAQFHRDVVRQAISNVVERALHDLENVVLHHSRLVANRDNNVPLGELRHTQGNRAKARM